MTAAAAQEFRVRQGDTGRWHVDRHVGIFAETVATYDTRDEATADVLNRNAAVSGIGSLSQETASSEASP